MKALLTPEEIEDYHRDGMLVVRGVLTEVEVETAREVIERVLAEGGMLTQVASGVDDPGRFVEDFRRWQEFPQLERLALGSAVPRYATELLAGWTAPEQPVRFYHDHVLVKEGGTQQRTPWHQDQPGARGAAGCRRRSWRIRHPRGRPAAG